MCRGVYIHYFKINPPHFLLSPLFWKLSQLSGQDQRNGKHTVDYHPSPSQLISRIHTLIFLWTPKGFISPESFLNFFLNLYIPPWLWNKKSNLFIFNHAPNQNSPPGFYHYPPGRQDCPFLPSSIFWRYFFLRRMGGEDYGVEKITKINKGIGHKFW